MHSLRDLLIFVKCSIVLSHIRFAFVPKVGSFVYMHNCRVAPTILQIQKKKRKEKRLLCPTTSRPNSFSIDLIHFIICCEIASKQYESLFETLLPSSSAHCHHSSHYYRLISSDNNDLCSASDCCISTHSPETHTHLNSITHESWYKTLISLRWRVKEMKSRKILHSKKCRVVRMWLNALKNKK